jgi:hypothetical protein
MLHGIWWVWWTLGGAGTLTIALMAWLAPALLVQIVKSAIGFFIFTRIGNIIAAAAIAFLVGDVNRSIRDQNEFAARTASFEQAQQQRDAMIAEQTREQVTKEIAAAQAANAQTDKEVTEFDHAIPPVPYAQTNPFRVGADACRLRHIAGETQCGPASPTHGLPKARSATQGAADHPRHRLPGLVQRVLGHHRKGTARPSS